MVTAAGEHNARALSQAEHFLSRLLFLADQSWRELASTARPALASAVELEWTPEALDPTRYSLAV